ncbi:hypothetical protein L1987_29660 [Smallanthus sonchifolius]|uniref:Uncharacterized protein n=1 Tax=Smallanthus sonchifolius TaxID=185202 RepID=A0ACB9I3A9_9ASTR|nr:hypothetical protein L1987_29660 [Smallanthus sonchifolius]
MRYQKLQGGNGATRIVVDRRKYQEVGENDGESSLQTMSLNLGLPTRSEMKRLMQAYMILMALDRYFQDAADCSWGNNEDEENLFLVVICSFWGHVVGHGNGSLWGLQP